jgi:ATP phosphoribosyltransferase
MARPTRFLTNLLGSWYPENYIVAVIDHPAEAEQAAEALRKAGWPAMDVRLFAGTEVATHLNKIEEHRSLPKKLAADVRHVVSDEGIIGEDYEEEARLGHQILAVYTPNDNKVEQARTLLTAHGAHSIEYFGKWVITDLPQVDDTTHKGADE